MMNMMMNRRERGRKNQRKCILCFLKIKIRIYENEIDGVFDCLLTNNLFLLFMYVCIPLNLCWIVFVLN
jgi:hypothetical protein